MTFLLSRSGDMTRLGLLSGIPWNKSGRSGPSSCHWPPSDIGKLKDGCHAADPQDPPHMLLEEEGQTVGRRADVLAGIVAVVSHIHGLMLCRPEGR